MEGIHVRLDDKLTSTVPTYKLERVMLLQKEVCRRYCKAALCGIEITLTREPENRFRAPIDTPNIFEARCEVEPCGNTEFIQRMDQDLIGRVRLENIRGTL